LLCSKIKGLPFGLISTFFLGINPLFFAFGRKAMTDSMQLLAFILNLLLFMLLTKTLDKNDKKKTILLSLAMGVNAAFGVGVKVSGILTLLFLAIMFPILLILQRLHKRPHRLLILSYSIIGISFFTIFVSLHPYLYHDPLRRFFSMFTDRLAEDVVNRTLLPLHAVHGGNAALKLILIRTLISDEITNFNFYGIPVDLFLLPVGLFVLAKKALKTLFDKRTISGELILVAWFLVAFISLTFYLRLDLPRYYIPTLASITIIQSYALIYLLHDLWFVSRKKTRQKLGRPKTTVGYTPESVVRAVKENAPPTSYVPEADWNAWAGAAGWHEWLHTLPSKNHTETMHVAWEFGVMTSTYAFLLPEIVNDTYVAMKWLYYEVAVGAFVHPVGGFDQLPPQVIVESVKIVGADASPADEKMKEKALNQISREEQEQSIQERIKRSE
jgi:hypothetical protein